MMPSIDKLYVVLEDRDESRVEKPETFLESIFPHLSLTANIYVIASGLSHGISLLERVQKKIKAFLKKHRFVRYNLHFLHPLPQGGGVGEAEYFCQYYYQPWKRGSIEFDREGYIHQEIPRLALFTVVAAREKDQVPFLASLVGMLSDYGIFPSLYLQEDAAALEREKAVVDKIKKIYYGSGTSLTAEELACNTCGQDLVEASCAAFMAGTLSAAASCGATVFFTPHDGRIYPCLDAFSEGTAVANACEQTDKEAMIVRCHEARERERNCLACRQQVFDRFVSLPLPKGLREKVEAVRDHLLAL